MRESPSRSSQPRTTSMSGPGLSQTKNRFTPIGRKQIDQPRHAVGLHSRFGSAEVDAVHIDRCDGSLSLGIDGDIAAAERRALKLPANETARPAVCIQPNSKPVHFEG